MWWQVVRQGKSGLVNPVRDADQVEEMIARNIALEGCNYSVKSRTETEIVLQNGRAYTDTITYLFEAE